MASHEVIVIKIGTGVLTKADGTLDGIFLDRNPLGSFTDLRNEVLGVIGGAGGPQAAADFEVELDAAYDLRYEYVVEAITAVTGFVKDGQIQKLVEKVKFAQPRKPEGTGG